MINREELVEFVKPYYKDKDLMHDLSHIERVEITLDKLIEGYKGKEKVDLEALKLALYFHGFIYAKENIIRDWLEEKGLGKEGIDKVVQVAWESQKSQEAVTTEGQLLHDAHMVEGGEVFLLIKSLITGSVRGQTLDQTMSYIEENILDQGQCYLEEAKEIYRQQQDFAKETLAKLKLGLSQ